MKWTGILIFLFSTVAYSDVTAQRGIPDALQILRGQISADIHPLSNIVVPSYGFSLGSYVNNQNLVEFQYSKGSIGIDKVLLQSGVTRKLHLNEIEDELEGELAGVYQDINRTDITHELIAFQHRYFWTPIFYSKAGMGLKRYSIEYPVSEISQYEDLSASLAVSRPALTLGLGHRWMVGSLAVGMEWFNATIPLAYFERKDSSLPKNSMVYKYNKFSNKIIYGFCSFSAGVIF